MKFLEDALSQKVKDKLIDNVHLKTVQVESKCYTIKVATPVKHNDT